MVAVTSGRVLLTGGTGYIGMWGIKYLLEGGYTVVAAVRNERGAAELKKLFPSDKLETILVPVIEAPGAYDDAVKGVDAIIHMASPVTYNWEDPKEVLDPAVQGATGILKSAATYGKSVKRVVLTSSTVTISPVGDQRPESFDESDWETESLAHVKENGKKSHPGQVYTASKVTAEKAAWEFVKNNDVTFDLVTVLPGLVFGPIVGSTPTSSVNMFLRAMKEADLSGNYISPWVDVRDVTIAHLKALETPAAGGQRIASIAVTPELGSMSWLDAYDALATRPDVIDVSKVPGAEKRGIPRAKGPVVKNERSLSLFPSLQYRSLSDSFVDMAQDLKSKGLVTV